jgi:methylenetetrahydrofolate reductase (NADPH)
MPKDAMTIRELFAAGQRSYSFELFPPRGDADEALLWPVLRELEALSPTFASVTYGAGGSSRERTVRLTNRITSETTLTVVGHLTCVGSSLAELRSVIGGYADAGVCTVLALRGDPPAGTTPASGDLTHAEELVALVRSLGDFCVGVAAYPNKHPESPDLMADAKALARKAAAGADFAITQFFFSADAYFSLRDRLALLGCDIPIIAGVMPVTNIHQIERFANLSGTALPPGLIGRLQSHADDPEAIRGIGVEAASELSAQLLSGGAPGLHFYTLNRSTATREIYRNLGLPRASMPSRQ